MLFCEPMLQYQKAFKAAVQGCSLRVIEYGVCSHRRSVLQMWSLNWLEDNILFQHQESNIKATSGWVFQCKISIYGLLYHCRGKHTLSHSSQMVKLWNRLLWELFWIFIAIIYPNKMVATSLSTWVHPQCQCDHLYWFLAETQKTTFRHSGLDCHSIDIVSPLHIWTLPFLSPVCL